MSTVIQTLGPNAYGGFMEMAGEGDDASTHKALVKFHDTHRAVDSYVKIYCKDAAPKGFVNELIGYTLAKWSGLDVSRRAAVLLLNDEQVRFLPNGMAPTRNQAGQVVAWCVQSIGGPTPTQAYRFNDDSPQAWVALRRDFKKWKELPQVASLDAWLLNEDRNLGNLIRLGAGRYALIDHGRICSGNAWSAPLDRMKMKHVNKVAGIAWDDVDLDRAPEFFRDAIVQAYERYAEALIQAASDLDYWLPRLVSAADEAEAAQFFSERVTSVRDHLKVAYKVLL